MAELNVNIGNLPLKNPVMTASEHLDTESNIQTLWIFRDWAVFL